MESQEEGIDGMIYEVSNRLVKNPHKSISAAGRRAGSLRK